MSLSEQIIGKRTKIIRLWFKEVLECFPKQSRIMIANNSNHFSNPIGYTLREGIDEIFSFAVGEKSLEEIDLGLGRLIKLKAIQEVQDANPLLFLFALKKIVRENCGAHSSQFSEIKELLEIESRLDHIIQKAYEIYVQSREKILELQVNEIKNKNYMFRRLAGEH